MTARGYIVALAALAMLGIMLSAFAAKAQPYYFPMKILWFCHDKTDVMSVLNAPAKLTPKVLHFLIVTGKCGHGAFGTHFSFVPDAPGKSHTTSDGTEYSLVGGKIFSGGGTFSVFVAVTPGAVRSYPLNSGHSPPVKPGWGI